jgi:hypothetical protein
MARWALAMAYLLSLLRFDRTTWLFMKPSGGAGRTIVESLVADAEKRHNHTQEVFVFPFPRFNIDDDDAKNERAARVNIITAHQFVELRTRHHE